MESKEQLLTDEEARKVLYRILSLYPDAKGELNWDTHFHLVCAVMISAQTTDKMVNSVTPKLFSDYPDSFAMAKAELKDIEEDIKKIGLFHTKAKHLKETAQIISSKYHGKVPNNKKELMALPGVGEKTANVVLAEGFGVPAIAVDTHVSRISKRFKIVGAKASPHEISLRLQELLPKGDWIRAHHAMILFGRYTMPARTKDKNPYDFLPPENK
ncbi:endonuclease III [Lactobacillus sp. PV034]|uniref:endonuclease III n=1 Tax=Lactobacillus sp. PV034 TaxID=2594495 RepID=UPI00223F6BF6|nr:endonuclease III [Lactobacillus sp. PV034]QNQ80411.1 endonuclease III [Lactobacillus sp. PV034]